jgi:L-aspartate oxidase
MILRTIQIHKSSVARSIGISAREASNLWKCTNVNFPTSSRKLTTARAADDHDRLLVVGSGVAGSAAALIAAETYKMPVTLIFAGNLPQDCNSNWAQGGIIYRNYDPNMGDSAAALAKDIHRAGAGLCEDDAVRKVSEEGPDRVRQLLLNGGPFADVPFDKKPDGELSLCLGESLQLFPVDGW